MSSLSSSLYQRNQISIHSLTCNNSNNSYNNDNNSSSFTLRHASSSPPFASSPWPSSSTPVMKSRDYCRQINHHHPYVMGHSISHPGTTSSAISTMMGSPPTSPPTSPLYRYNKDDSLNNQLQERRQRNKAASAKYRQKKNIQLYEMRSMICQMSNRNAMLERQLLEMKQENQALKVTADKLRSKLLATKLLRQWLRKNPQQVSVDEIEDENELLMDY